MKLKRRSEKNWDYQQERIDSSGDEDNSDAEEMYNSPQQTRYDGVKNLWLSVIANAIQNKSKGFLRGGDDSNLRFACYATGLDMDRVQELAKGAR